MTAQPLVSPESVSRWWGIEPVLQSASGGKRGSCALWRFRAGPEDIEVAGEADPDTHIISIGAAGRSRQEYFGDGRLHFKRSCSPGLLNIVRAGEKPRAVLSGATSSWSYFHVYLPHALLVDAAAEAGLTVQPGGIEVVDPQGTEDDGIWQTTRTIMRELIDQSPLSRLRVETLHQDVAIQILRRHSNLGLSSSSGTPARGGLAPWQLRRAIDAIEAHLGDDFGLDMLAEVAGCSPTHFSRAFKRSTGMSPFQRLLERRIARAKDMLGVADISLAEVALAVGFSAQPQFTTAFRRVTGTTPGAWRRDRAG